MRVPRGRRGDLALPGAASRKAQTMLKRESPDDSAGVSANGARTASRNEFGAKPLSQFAIFPRYRAASGRRGITDAARFLQWLEVNSSHNQIIFRISSR